MGDDLFTVRAQGQTLIPAAQLTATGELDRAVSQLVRVLREADMDGWSLWAWLCSPSGLLSGGIPAVVVHASPDRVLRAARRTASDLQAHSGAQ